MNNQPIDPTKDLGDDATATFESDPKFIEPTPGSEGSSDNIEEQKSTLQARDTDDVIDSDEETADAEDDDEFEDDEDEEEDDEDEDEDDLEDDQDEVPANAKMLAADDTQIEADDDAGDVAEGIDEDALVDDDDLDTDRVVAMTHFAAQVMAARAAVYGERA